MIDSANNLYLTCNFAGGHRFAYVALMYAPAGALDWASFLTSTDASQAHGLGLDTKRNLIVTGQLNSDLI